MPQIRTAADGTLVIIRPIAAADLALEQEFVDSLSPSTGYMRLMSSRRPTLEELRRFTDIDTEREYALIAIIMVKGRELQIGVARYVKDDSTPGDAEFAIVLRDDWQKRSLGTELLIKLVDAAKRHGVQRLVGATLAQNAGMLALARKMGICLKPDLHSATVINLTADVISAE